MGYWYSPSNGYHEGDSVYLDDIAAPARPSDDYVWQNGSWTLDPAKEENSIYEAAIPAGVAVVSTGTPTLNGTYSLSDAARGNIAATYVSIKNGDGLPGGGESFQYPDHGMVFHTFTATTFVPFAIAVRDYYYYALTQGQSPAQPVTIP